MTITLSAPLVVQGAQTTAHGHAFRNTGSGPVPVNDVDFQWSVSDSTIARIVNDGRGTATITGVNTGLVHVVAQAAVYAKATAMDSIIRVAHALEIDSIKPSRTSSTGAGSPCSGWGSTPSSWLRSGAGTLIPDTFSFVGNRNGLGQYAILVRTAVSGTGQRAPRSAPVSSHRPPTRRWWATTTFSILTTPFPRRSDP